MTLGLLWWLVGLGVLILASPIALYTWYEVQRIGWERRVLPADLGIERVVAARPAFWRAPILGGAACAEYQMDDVLRERIERYGLGALRDSRENEYGVQLSEWAETPVRENILAGGDSAYGMRGQCGPEFADALRSIVRQPGSYYAHNGAVGDELFVFISPSRHRIYFIAYWGG